MSRGSLLILGRSDVERLLQIDDMLAALERAFIALSAEQASVPPRIAARAPEGLLGAMPGYLPGVLELKAVTVFPANLEQGVPSHQGLILLFDESNGTPLAVMDAVHITALRTAGGSAVSVRRLASPKARVLAILGAGAQGRSHLEVVPRVRDFTEIRIASRSGARAAKLAESDPRAEVAGSIQSAVEGADVVCCCTDAREPVIRYEWLKPGAHVTAVGGTFGPEVDPETVKRAHLFVEFRGAITNPPPAGAADLQGVDPNRATEMGELLSGERPGRESLEEITLYRSVGHAVEDAVTARLVYDRAIEEGAGQRVLI